MTQAKYKSMADDQITEKAFSASAEDYRISYEYQGTGSHEQILKLTKQSKGYFIVKRIFDIISASLLLVVIWPIIVVIGIAIKLDSKGPIIYKHKRVGRYYKPIYLYKFRSMVKNADDLIAKFTPEQRKIWNENFKLEHDPRVTKVGRFLRKTSLDELPQLINIIKGEMSVVGPRPVVEDELKKYGKDSDKFVSFPPGLTGYWQAYARSDCSYAQRMRMEVFYIDRANFWWDMKIIFATVGAMLRGNGAR
jgi:lipopolysaccharide/colanic/teichoic acid biosynthesis glycosyltransferase